MIGSPNFQGSLLGSTPNDFDHFQTNWTNSTKNFIFVHFHHCRNHSTFSGILTTANDRNYCPLQFKTISHLTDCKKEPESLAFNFVSIVFQIIQNIRGLWVQLKQWSCDKTRRDRASKFSGDSPRINTKRFQPLSDGFTMFTKKFIFVHFVHCRNRRTFEGILTTEIDRTHYSQQLKTISSLID